LLYLMKSNYRKLLVDRLLLREHLQDVAQEEVLAVLPRLQLLLQADLQDAVQEEVLALRRLEFLNNTRRGCIRVQPLFF